MLFRRAHGDFKAWLKEMKIRSSQRMFHYGLEAFLQFSTSVLSSAFSSLFSSQEFIIQDHEKKRMHPGAIDELQGLEWTRGFGVPGLNVPVGYHAAGCDWSSKVLWKVAGWPGSTRAGDFSAGPQNCASGTGADPQTPYEHQFV